MAKPKEPDGKDIAERWLARIEKAEKDSEEWWKTSKLITDRYRNKKLDPNDNNAAKRINIFWSNVRVLQPSLYSKKPKPNVDRKHKDSAPVARLASQILERALIASIEPPQFDDCVKQARDDRLLSGRGLVWLRYDPTFGEERAQRIPVTKSDTGSYYGAGQIRAASEVQEDDMGPFVPGEMFKPVTAERVSKDFVHHKDFVHADAPSWDKVYWAARRVWMTKRQLAERFEKSCPGCSEQIATKANNEKGSDKPGPRDTAPIWEIWDKDKGEVLWISPLYKEGPLDVKPDPLGLENFWPCPRPFYSTLTPDSLIPVPDYEQYKDQAIEMDRITDRIMRLTKAIRVAGVYNGAVPELQTLLNDSDGDEFVAAGNWAAFAEKGGLSSAFDMLPFDEIAKALKILMEARDSSKRDLYEVTGISDIIRGDTAAGETATAQRLKGQFATLRLREQQDDMQRFVRDVVQIDAEIICEHFSPEQIAKMSFAEGLLESQIEPLPNEQPEETKARGMQMLQEALALLKDQGARDFEISIETDSTIQADEEADKQSAVEFLTSVTQFIAEAQQLGAMSPAIMDLLLELLKFGVRRFRAGRDLENQFEATAQKIKQEMQAKAQQPPKPTEEEMKIKLLEAEGQAKMQDHQASIQAEQAKAQTEAQRGQNELAMDAQAHTQKMQLSWQEGQQKMKLARIQHGQKLAHDAQSAQQKLEHAEMSAEQESREAGAGGEPLNEPPGADPDWKDPQAEALQQLAQAIFAMVEQQGKPKRIARGANGEKRVEIVN